MNVQESIDINNVLGFFLEVEDPHKHYSEATARVAASRLAERANKTLSAGMSGATLAAAWNRWRRGVIKKGRK
jgi:hypothetical protein